jgi:hypothetical protein
VVYLLDHKTFLNEGKKLTHKHNRTFPMCEEWVVSFLDEKIFFKEGQKKFTCGAPSGIFLLTWIYLFFFWMKNLWLMRDKTKVVG